MTVFSQNGWPAYADTKRFVRTTAAGRTWWSANADVATVMDEFVEQFDKRVEPVIRPGEELDDWSWADRLVRGSTSVVSNHGSATARDLNALHHPRGVHDTYTPKQQREMHRIRDEITDDSGDPVLRLGMDYTTTVDDMHVEIDAGPRRVHEAAEKIRRRKKDVMATLDKDDIAAIADAVWHRKTIEITPAAAKAIGSPDVKPGDRVAGQYLLQWSPLARRSEREDLARDNALAEADRARDATIKAVVDDLAVQVGHLTTGVGHLTTGGVDVDALATAVADKLAARLQT